MASFRRQNSLPLPQDFQPAQLRAPRQTRRNHAGAGGKQKQPRRGLGVAQLERIRLAGSSSASQDTVPVHFSGGLSPAPAPLLDPQGQFQPVQVNPSPTPANMIYPNADRCILCHQKKKSFVERFNMGGVHSTMTNYRSNMHQGNIQAEAGIGHKRSYIVEYNFFGVSEKCSRSRLMEPATWGDQLGMMTSGSNHFSFAPAEMVGPISGAAASCVTTSTGTGGGGGGGTVDAPSSIDLSLRLSSY